MIVLALSLAPTLVASCNLDTPPSGYEHYVETQPPGSDLGAVRSAAVEGLRQRLCRSVPDKTACDRLNIVVWGEHQASGDNVCARAVVAERELVLWRSSLRLDRSELDRELRKLIDDKSRVAISEIKDLQGDTERILWFKSLLGRVLTDREVDAIDISRAWSDANIPAQAEKILICDLSDAAPDRETGERLFTASCKSRRREDSFFREITVSFPTSSVHGPTPTSASPPFSAKPSKEQAAVVQQVMVQVTSSAASDVTDRRASAPQVPLRSVAMWGGGALVVIGGLLVGGGGLPAIMVADAEGRFSASPEKSLEDARYWQRWYDDGVVAGLFIGGGVAVALGATGVAASFVLPENE